MRTRITFVFGCILALVVNSGIAQSKVYRPVSLWPEWHVEYVFRNNSSLFFRNHYRHVLAPDLNLLQDRGPLQYLQHWQFRLGYEHMLSPSWYLGIAEAIALERDRLMLFHEVSSRYSRNVGKLRISQRHAFMHMMRRPGTSNGRYRLRTNLDCTFFLGGKRLRPQASYELFFDINYHPQASPGLGSRHIDHTRLRLQCQTGLNKQLFLTPYFIRQTDYNLTSSGLDLGGKPIEKKQNQIRPIYGLELRYSVFAAR